MQLDAPDNMKNVVVNSDITDIVKEIPDESVHLTFTSPPYYNARDYSTYKSYEDYLDFLSLVFDEVHRITKEGRFLVVNTSPIIIPRPKRNSQSKRYAIPFDLHNRLTQLGWEFIDDIIWVKPDGASKNRIGGFLQHGKPLGYKPNPVTEYVMVYRKKTDKLIDWNMKQYSKEIVERSRIKNDVDRTNIWYINPTKDPLHPAVFPEELCEKVIRYYSYGGDLVFDPFAGSGTVGKTAMKLNRYFFLTEMHEKYFNEIKQKLSTTPIHVLKKPSFYQYEEYVGKKK